MNDEMIKLEEELSELKAILQENNIEIQDVDDVVAVSACSKCCSSKNGGG